MPPDRYESPEENLARLLQRKRYAQAIDILRTRLAQRRPDPRTRLRLADLLVAAGRAAEAVPVLLALSDELAATGQLSKAVAALKRVERLEPKRSDIQARLQRLVAERHRLASVATAEVESQAERPERTPEPAAAPPEAVAAEAPPEAAPGEEPAADGAPIDDKVAVRFRGLLGRLLGGRGEGSPELSEAADQAAARPPEGEEIGLAPLRVATVPAAPRAETEAEALPEATPALVTPAPPQPPPAEAAGAPTPAAAEGPPAPVTPPPATPALPASEARGPERRGGLRGLLGRLFGRASEDGPDEPALVEPEATLPPPGVPPPEPVPPESEPAPSAPASEPAGSDEAATPPPASETAAATPAEIGSEAAPAAPSGGPEPAAERSTEPEPPTQPTPATAPATGAAAAMNEDDFHERLLDVVEEMLQRDTPADAVPEAPEPVPAARRLHASPLLGELDEAELERLVARLRLRTCEPGDILLTEGERGETLFLLVGGTVKIFVRNQESRNVAVLELREGDFFGEIAVLSGRPRSATVTAATPCELLELDRATLDELARTHPGMVDTLEAYYLARTQSDAAATLREAGLGPEARRRAEAVLRSHFGDGGFEPRTRLKLADALLRSGKREDAQAILASLADDLARHGYPEKAVSILKKIERLQGRGVEEILLAPLRRPAEAGPAPSPPSAAAEARDETFHGWLLELVHDSVERGRLRRAPVPGLLMSPLFEDLSEEELLSLVRGLRLVTAEPGDVLVSEGEAGNSVFVVTSGCVKVFVRDPSGGSVPVGRLAEGDFFGEISLLSGRPRSATITAAAPCELLELDRAAFERVCAQHPRMRSVMEEVYIQRASHPLAARIRGTGEQP